MWSRATGRTIELIHQGKRITTHVRSFVKYDYSTHPEHRPASHRTYLEWTPLRLIEWGRSIGAHTAAVIDYVIRETSWIRSRCAPTRRPLNMANAGRLAWRVNKKSKRAWPRSTTLSLLVPG
jgi:hypothetical protein